MESHFLTNKQYQKLEKIEKFEPHLLFSSGQFGLNERYSLISRYQGFDTNFGFTYDKLSNSIFPELASSTNDIAGLGADTSTCSQINLKMSQEKSQEKSSFMEIKRNKNINSDISYQNYEYGAYHQIDSSKGRFTTPFKEFIKIQRTFSDAPTLINGSVWQGASTKIDYKSEAIDDILHEVWPSQKTQKPTRHSSMYLGRMLPLQNSDKATNRKSLNLDFKPQWHLSSGSNSAVSTPIIGNFCTNKLENYSEDSCENIHSIWSKYTTADSPICTQADNLDGSECFNTYEVYQMKLKSPTSTKKARDIFNSEASYSDMIKKRERIKLVAGLAERAAARKLLSNQLQIAAKI